MAEVGTFALWITLLLSLYAIPAFLIGRSGDARLVESAKNAVLGAATMVTVAAGILLQRLIVTDFSLAYVANHTSTDLPLAYRISAFWAGQEGSLLLWLWLMAIMAAVAVRTRRSDVQNLVPYVGAILSAVMAFFALLTTFVTKPFVLLATVPEQGASLNPLLQNPGMIIHPTTLFIGYVGLAVPFAYAMATLWQRRSDDAWLQAARPWTLGAWLFLSVGIIYGAQWAYVELGWGGYWAWDPVENASLMPWLIATAFFHSAIMQEKRGIMKGWCVGLITGAFWLTLFGTYITRSGVLKSVHAFSDTYLGVYFLTAMLLTLAGAIYLMVSRRKLLQPEVQIESIVSKEASFLAGNLVFTAAACAILFGTMYPLISEVLQGASVSVGPPFFNKVFVPFGLAAVLLAGLAPLLAWRKSSTENMRRHLLLPAVGTLLIAALLAAFGVRNPGALIASATAAFTACSVIFEIARGAGVHAKTGGTSYVAAFGRLFSRNRRRYGAYLVHLSVVMLIVGIVGSSVYSVSSEVALNRGESAQLGEYTITFSGLKEMRDGDTKAIVYTDLAVSKNGRPVGTVRPEKMFTAYSEEPTSEVSILGSLAEDFYVALSGWNGPDQGMFKLIINPLVAWLWLGEYLLVVGTLVAVWPRKRPIASVQPQKSQETTVASGV